MPLLDDGDLETLGLNFAIIERPEAEPKDIKSAVVLEDERTNEDIREQALSLVANALDLPTEVVDRARIALGSRTAELRDYVMQHVVPVVLSINPAMVSVQQMVPLMFENGEDTPVDVPLDNLSNFAQGIGVMATKMKIIELMGFSDEVRQRLMQRLVPLQAPTVPNQAERS